MRKAPQIFPFECQFTGGSYNFKGQIIQVGNNGFMCNTGKQVLKPSENLTAKFTFPMLNKTVEIGVMSYKIYDKFKGKHNSIQAGDHLIEFVFKNPDAKFRDLLIQFTAHVQAYQY